MNSYLHKEWIDAHSILDTVTSETTLSSAAVTVCGPTWGLVPRGGGPGRMKRISFRNFSTELAQVQ
jgi:hypothetical protein